MEAPAAERLDLEALFAVIRELPPKAGKRPAILPRICPESKLRIGEIR
jgi:hypothetical protein